MLSALPPTLDLQWQELQKFHTRSQEVAIVPAQQAEGGPRRGQGDTSHWPKRIVSFTWKVINGRKPETV